MWAKLYSILCLILLGTSHAVNARDISIFSNDFASHVKEAKPGDTLIIEPGTYWITKEVKLDIAGTEINPITIKPAPVGKVTIYSDSRVVFKVEAPYWTIENLDIIGKCGDHGKCEHALHITGHADHTTIRGNRLIDFNAQIKGNGLIEDRRQYFPDHVLIENNQLYNRSSRDTGNPVTPIDVVGGRFWTIRDNFIADFHKGRGNQISYAAFLKGNSDNGVFERNLIICEWAFSGGVRLGLSLGGGGTTNRDYCQGRSCIIEHYNGTIRNNIIMNCPADVGIYLNNAASTTIANNTILNTLGVDVRFNGSFAVTQNNVIQGRIKGRDGGRFREDHNLVEEDFDDLFPAWKKYDLTPSDSDDIMEGNRDYQAKDFCTGKTMEGQLGAIAEPAACTVRQKLIEVRSKPLE